MKIIKVGRSSSNDVVIQNDGYVGRTHCEFIQDDNGNYWVVDMNSTNGTFVNGVRRSGKTQLSSNDMVRIGNTMLPWKNYFSGVASTEGEQPPRQAKPYNYLVWAILSTIFCSLPFGIVSIVFASKVDSRWYNGDYTGAIDAAHKAKVWFWISFGIGLFVNICLLIYYMIFIGIIAGDIL